MSSDEVDNPAPVEDVQEDSGEDVWQQEPNKRRKGDVRSWKKNVAKRQRDSGQAYVSVTTKKNVAARQPGPPCTCPLRCYDSIGQENIPLIFEKYYNLGSHDAQSAYIVIHVQSHDVKRMYAGPSSRRTCTREYSVELQPKNMIIIIPLLYFLSATVKL